MAIKIELTNQSVLEANEAFCRLKRQCSQIGVSGGRMVKWSRPNASEVKINVDGSSQLNVSRAGVGCIARSHQGKWVFGKARNIGRANS